MHRPGGPPELLDSEGLPFAVSLGLHEPGQLLGKVAAAGHGILSQGVAEGPLQTELHSCQMLGMLARRTCQFDDLCRLCSAMRCVHVVHLVQCNHA